MFRTIPTFMAQSNEQAGHQLVLMERSDVRDHCVEPAIASTADLFSGPMAVLSVERGEREEPPASSVNSQSTDMLTGKLGAAYVDVECGEPDEAPASSALVSQPEMLTKQVRAVVNVDCFESDAPETVERALDDPEGSKPALQMNNIVVDAIRNTGKRWVSHRLQSHEPRA